jgi:hypothetical protein
MRIGVLYHIMHEVSWQHKTFTSQLPVLYYGYYILPALVYKV